ncbi:MAG: alanine--tRNA ligase [Pseudomonadota bacterium]|nr:alanine--tRNA ligase [Pseudomonadota bacterium]
MKTTQLRKLFLDYFSNLDHELVPSSSLIPGNDPTLLFTNAGMVQFKDIFLGKELRDYSRATSSQRCVRAGGKHNDLDNVGYTARHHTFFEMLGNFSFGDYFKDDAIKFAWEFLTIELNLPPDKLWITVHEDDDEASNIWLNTLGVDPERFSRLGERDNFWSMGDCGPCGPCSEIFYDHGSDLSGGPPGSSDEGDRFVEIWNLVFMQYDRQSDGQLLELPKPSVDTGMGLERMAAVLQGVKSNYEIDLFKALIKAAAEVTSTSDLNHSSLKVISDHIRSAAFLILDGVMPGRDGRSYVLRRIIRRALRHGHELGVKGDFFYKLVIPLVDQMSEAYPALAKEQKNIQKVILQEEQRFSETLSQGMKILDKKLQSIDGGILPGEIAFTLYDTYGFPVDLTEDILRARNLDLDKEGFLMAMNQQRTRARSASKFSLKSARDNINFVTEFCGHDKLKKTAIVSAIFKDGIAVESLVKAETAEIILDVTPFYAEGGGQLGDKGFISSKTAKFAVIDTKPINSAHLHFGTLKSGTMMVGDKVTAEVDFFNRTAITLNHTATHILHATLRNILGKHVEQKGSLVAADRLRFDFSHLEPITPEQLLEIEKHVNNQIRSNALVRTELMNYEDALNSGALALFGEKYGDNVRVLKVGDYSIELCGGTHVRRAGDIGLFKITSESGIASGVRRIEALTGEAALIFVNTEAALLGRITQILRTDSPNLEKKIHQIQKKNREYEKEIKASRQHDLVDVNHKMASNFVAVGDIKVLAARLQDNTEMEELRLGVDRLKDQFPRAVVLLGCASDDGKVYLAAGVTKNITSEIKAGDLIRDISAHVGGKGGGRPDFAQAGGSDPALLDHALSLVVPWVRDHL